MSFDDLLARSMASRTVTTSLMGAFSLLSLLVATLGIYSMIAFTTLQRKRELAIRRALGSGRRAALSSQLDRYGGTTSECGAARRFGYASSPGGPAARPG